MHTSFEEAVHGGAAPELTHKHSGRATWASLVLGKFAPGGAMSGVGVRVMETHWCTRCPGRVSGAWWIVPDKLTSIWTQM